MVQDVVEVLLSCLEVPGGDLKLDQVKSKRRRYILAIITATS
jgi:hypothetical protein